MRVIVTGGTGFIGRALTLALSRRQDDVVVVSRHTGRAHPRSIRWDEAPRALEEADAVVHLAGEPVASGRWTQERLDRIRSSRIETTELLARAIARAAKKPRVFVSASAVGIYGMRSDGAVLDEGAEHGDDVLARIVVDWEAAADPARGVTRVVHPRTGIVLGRGGGALASMLPAFRWYVGGALGGGKQWLSWVHVEDAVRALLFALDHEALEGPFNVTAPEPVDMDAFAKTLGRAIGRPSALRVPRFALRAALGRGLAEVLLTGQRALPRKLVDAGFTFHYRRLEAALGDLFPHAEAHP